MFHLEFFFFFLVKYSTMHLELLWPQQKTQLWKISQQIDNYPGRIWVLCGAEKQNRALSFCDTRVSVCDSHRSLQSTSHHRKKPKILTSFFVFFNPSWWVFALTIFCFGPTLCANWTAHWKCWATVFVFSFAPCIVVSYDLVFGNQTIVSKNKVNKLLACGLSN